MNEILRVAAEEERVFIRHARGGEEKKGRRKNGYNHSIRRGCVYDASRKVNQCNDLISSPD